MSRSPTQGSDKGSAHDQVTMTTGSDKVFDTDKKAPTPTGFCVYGILADGMATAIALGKPIDRIVDIAVETQRQFHVACPNCGTAASISTWTRDEIGKLYGVAKSIVHGQFRHELERQYRQFVCKCAKCGQEGRLPQRVQPTLRNPEPFLPA